MCLQIEFKHKHTRYFFAKVGARILRLFNCLSVTFGQLWPHLFAQRNSICAASVFVCTFKLLGVFNFRLVISLVYSISQCVNLQFAFHCTNIVDSHLSDMFIIFNMRGKKTSSNYLETRKCAAFLTSNKNSDIDLKTISFRCFDSVKGVEPALLSALNENCLISMHFPKRKKLHHNLFGRKNRLFEVNI